MILHIDAERPYRFGPPAGTRPIIRITIIIVTILVVVIIMLIMIITTITITIIRITTIITIIVIMSILIIMIIIVLQPDRGRVRPQEGHGADQPPPPGAFHSIMQQYTILCHVTLYQGMLHYNVS